MREVYLSGIAMTPFGKHPNATLKSLGQRVMAGALDDASASTSDVQAVYFANAVGGSLTGQEMIRGQAALRPSGLGRTPVINVENACASGSSALHLAWLAVASGQHDTVLGVAAEKMTHPDKSATFAAIGRAVDVDTVEEAPELLKRSPFLDIYAAEARQYIESGAATVEDLARVAVKNLGNGRLNPNAQYGLELDIAAVLKSRQILDPLTLYMCSPVSDGAAAVLLTSEPAEWPGRRHVRIAASIVVGGHHLNGDPRKGSAFAAERAYEMAGVGPHDVDVAEVHDAAASAELSLYEQLGLAPFGAGAKLIRDGTVDLHGRTPVNPSGGLLARGHPIGATGLAQIHELVLQLRGEAGTRQVRDPRVALAHNAGGWLGGDSAVHCVHILT